MSSTFDDQAFHLMVNVRTLPKKGQMVLHTANPEECTRIAKQFELESVESFKGECLLTPWKRDGVKLSGMVKAKFTQPCSITMEPIEVALEEEVDIIFVPDGSKLSRPRTNDEGEIIFDPSGDDLPETFVGDSIDVASVWLEFMALGIDPFARKEGAVFQAQEIENADELAADSPFAALSSLKKH
jgi:uncharacterized metal-binding protein YceD (DUF177 family)